MTASSSRAKSKSAPRKSPPAVPPAPGGRRRLRTPLIVFFGVLILGVLAGWGRFVWQRVGPYVESGRQYQVDPSTIEVSPTPPTWLRADVRTEVLRGAGWDEPLSALDEGVPARIAGIFEFHPWVAAAHVTLRYPAKVSVELQYRRPAALLVTKDATTAEQVVLDATGFRVPDQNLRADFIGALPKIGSIDGQYLPLVGQRVEEDRLRGAAEIAGLLADVWQAFKLARIEPLPSMQKTGERLVPVYHLKLLDGHTINWGPAPSNVYLKADVPQFLLGRLRILLESDTWQSAPLDTPIEMW